MEAEENQEIGKKVRLILNNNFHYQGIILDSSTSFIILRDKFDQKVTINRANISVMEEISK